MNAAKCIWYKQLKETIVTIKNFKQVQVSVGLYKDKNEIRRLFNVNMEHFAKHPNFLFFILGVEQCHRKVKYNRVKETLYQLRTRYWIVRGRKFVKKFIVKCTTCKRHEGATDFISVAIVTRFMVRNRRFFLYTRVGLCEDGL